MSRLRVILVDDQQLILLGLERMLRRMRNAWEVVVADSGRKARDLMEAQPFDILITDLNMPGYGGVELLDWTRAQLPGTVRIVLSGHQNKKMIDGATRSAHRFLTKPCDPDLLLATIAQVSSFFEPPSDGLALRRAVGGMGQLPGSPVTCHLFKAYLNNPEAPVEALRDLVQQDPGLAARTLQFVNSAFFGMPVPMVEPWEATQLLDRDKLANLAADPAEASLETRLKPLRDAHLHLARRALAITRAEQAPLAVQHLAYSAGLLGAAGPMILATAYPTGLPEGSAVAPETVPALARQYLNLMGLPGPLLDIVGGCLEPSRVQGEPALALAAVHVAAFHLTPEHLDSTFLARAGVLERVPSWREAMLGNEG